MHSRQVCQNSELVYELPVNFVRWSCSWYSLNLILFFNGSVTFVTSLSLCSLRVYCSTSNWILIHWPQKTLLFKQFEYECRTFSKDRVEWVGKKKPRIIKWCCQQFMCTFKKNDKYSIFLPYNDFVSIFWEWGWGVSIEYFPVGWACPMLNVILELIGTRRCCLF